MSKERITIKSVARRAGVSPTTVSLVMNSATTPNIPPETRQRVMEAVRELGYRPSASARQMRTRKSGMIGFIGDVVATTPFAVDIIQGAQQAAWERGRVLMVFNTGRDQQLEEEAVEVLLEHRAEGVIYAAMYHRPVEPPAVLDEIPTVLANCVEQQNRFLALTPDEFQGATQAVMALLERGHRRIGFINLPEREDIPAAVQRRLAYQAALERHAIPIDQSLIRIGGGETEGGYESAQALLSLPEPPTALFCVTDRMAMGAYDAIKELGLRIPDDVAVMGFDNQEILAAHLRPPLSTVQLPHYEMGKQAVLALLSDTPAAPAVRRLPCPMVWRDSV